MFETSCSLKYIGENMNSKTGISGWREDTEKEWGDHCSVKVLWKLLTFMMFIKKYSLIVTQRVGYIRYVTAPMFLTIEVLQKLTLVEVFWNVRYMHLHTSTYTAHFAVTAMRKQRESV